MAAVRKRRDPHATAEIDRLVEELYDSIERDTDIEEEIILSSRQLARGARVRIKPLRIVVCPSCEVQGYRQQATCSACRRGLIAQEEFLTVHVPAGHALGVVLRIRGKGHELSGRKAGDLLIRVSVDERSYAERVGAWLRATWRVPKRRRFAKVCIAVALLGIVGVVVLLDPGRADLGEPCSQPNDCRSGQCLNRRLPTRSVCTEQCDASTDCPVDMECVPVIRSETPLAALSAPANARACAPRQP